ncbi:aminotransferase class I/II-fold pyridoxal phosphate-dependent enzyme [Klebsiella pneumoniae]|uniref:Aminotransferase class I/II-fold pyridoxal phosphate-dependent enzyme n=2 Tax=Klebsiella pneumoniae TaxID=573 RepID=A0A332CLP6_KLEPN|nr:MULTISPECIES: aminotransferase class I/II-fold pyridoxal phosphate-dependent enzyme [Klebsiella]UYM65528.1 aminotransferase class I/II-fold pyridoxal phosphate-dependent enzyme [Escherichia coli]VED56303.1 aspartate aminotransferase [Klebsiella aerogenes]AFQ66097.1 Aspartate aminotransferase [Klebsiella pneumoniae subsp. pneumoniae 1084]AMA30128.1 aspartate aminotransferase [Klebsiella pneumoniae subsp. pneumoniae]AOE26910.1 aspartate aminotransferase [Klebsiella pneumoniae]
MPDFTASPLVDALEENLFSLLEKLAAEVNTEALPLIDLSSGSPDQPTPPEVIDSLQSAIHRRENHGYPSFWGKPQVREAIARFYRRQYDVELDPHSEVAVFQGSHIGIGGIPRALLSPGQYLISTDPCYPIYRSAALQSQAAFYGLPLRAENHFLPDFNDLPREVADKAGLVVLNYPHNPTGALATPALFASALQFARRHQVPILHDFAYAAIGSAASDAPLSLFSQPDAKAWGVETYTFSKTFNMAGWRFGFAVGNASIIRAFKKLHTHSYSTVFGAIQDAAIAALNLPAERITQLTAVYHQRREWVLRRLAALRWPARDAQGTFFLWLGVPPGYRSQEFARLLLQEAHILVAPGTGFGAGGEGFIRISLTAGDEALSNALDRLARLALF